MGATNSIKDVPETRRTEIQQSLRNSRAGFVGIGFLSVIINLLMLTGPLYMLQIYDRVLSSRSMSTLIALSLLMVGLYAFMWFFEHCRARIAARIGREIDADLGRRTFSVWLEQALYGEVGNQHKPLNDLTQLRTFLSGNGPIALFDVPWIPLYIGVIFILHWLLGVVAVIGASIILVVAALNEFRTRKPLQTSNQHKMQSLDYATKAHRNADVINAMGMEEVIQDRWAAQNEDYSKSALFSSDRIGGYSAFSKSFRMVLQSSILGIGGALAIAEVITPGAMIAASIIMGRALSPVQSALAQWQGFTHARQAYHRLNEFFIHIPPQKHVLALPSPLGELTVENVFAAPPGTSTPTLSAIDFHLDAGQGLGIIGPAAAGKTTLAKLLVGLWMPYSGHVRLDGATYNQWNKNDLGRHIGYLPQSVELLDGTIGENISRFYPDATAQKIIAAAKLAGAHRLILDFEDGYETVVGSGGASLSGGQIQRIALARALYGNPALIVLDEPNSNLDADGDAALKHAIIKIRQIGSTVIMITHRPSALVCVDMVLMLRDGKQVAFGSKEDVLQSTRQQALPKVPLRKKITHAPAPASNTTTTTAKPFFVGKP